MERKSKLDIKLTLKGLAMGLAEIIPGVSGGTIAFITGIYEELINTIKGVNPSLIGVLRKDGLRAFWKALNGNFLLMLLAGMLIGIGTGIFVIGYLLEFYPAPLWAFFFGLIIASALYIGKQISEWKVLTVLLVIIGFVIAFGITLVSPAEGSSNYIFVFLSGMVAISALILPGISGSFILLLLGMYTIIRKEAEMALSTFETSSILLIGVFALGCLVGLAVFSRVLSYTFKNYRDQTLAILTGFMLGSLNKIWPWRNPVSWLDKESGMINSDLTTLTNEILLGDKIQLIKEVKVLPQDYLFFQPQLGLCIAAFVLGMLVVYILDR